MFSILKTLSSQTQPSQTFSLGMNMIVRNASKKAGGTTRNHASGKGRCRGLKVSDGGYVYPNDTIATSPRIRWLPGMNVKMGSRFRLYALTEGKVAYTCEKADFNWDHSWAKKFFPDAKGVTLYKKYVHVLPKPQHNRFRLIKQI